MLPAKSNIIWKKLIKGEIKHQFKSVPAGLIISRISRSIKNDESPGNINKCLDEVYEFFKKYEKIFIDDINVIFGKEVQ
jgi:hypothetical protein